MTGLFNDVLSGTNTYIGESVQLSYEEESYLDIVSKDDYSLAGFVTEGLIEITDLENSITVAEAYGSKLILQGENRDAVMESLADKASAVYDTLKRWVTKIWRAIKKYVSKAWNHIKSFADKIRAYFSNYADVLQDYKGNVKVQWPKKLDIEALAQQVNADYDNALDNAGFMIKFNADQVTKNPGADTYTVSQSPTHAANRVHAVSNINTGTVVESVLKKWRSVLYGNEKGIEYESKAFSGIKGEVLRVADMGVDKYYKTFINFGEKDYRDAMSIHQDRVDDRQSRYDDIERPDYENTKKNEKDFENYAAKREAAHAKVMEARIKMQLRQHGIQMITKGCTQKYNAAIAAARKAISDKHGVASESYIPNDLSIIQMI